MVYSPTRTRKTAIYLCAIILPSVSTMCLAKAAQTRPFPQAIHPATRRTAQPSDNTAVEVNPPSLLWPAQKGKDVRYRIRLSQDRAFGPDKTIKSDELRWAIFNPHTRLTPGTWYWSYEVLKNGKIRDKSKTYRFIVSDSARTYATPASKQMLSACPTGHPRILITTPELVPFRQRMKSSPQAKLIVTAADKLIGREPPRESSATPRQKGKNAYEQRNYAKWASKALGNRLSQAAETLAKAYIITGDSEYGRQAIHYATHVAGFDPEGVTGRKVSDFADGACLRAMVVPYDSCFDLLTPQEKSELQSAIAFRAGRMFNSWRNNLETRVFSAHIWQHILHEFTEAAFATLGEVEQADLWASYVYELWLARVPLLGGQDGGWANGNNYFGTNFVTLISIPTFFKQLTGVDFFAHPWYRNVIYYMIYTWPPGSAPDGFGDGCEGRQLPPVSRLAFTDVLGKHFDDPCAGWYVRESLKPLRAKLEADGSLRWLRLRAGDDSPAPVSKPFDLPQARLFNDIGEVAMHTDLANPTKNLMVAFRSSPFGSFNHAHADQNSFNILFGGNRLFANSGYYIAYGDAHFKGWYKHSRGHDTILIDNKGQSIGTPDGYGWIARYLHGQRITYCLGDASHAYGNAGLTLFRRHVAFLRPSTVVIYDELEADHPAQWSWLLHCPAKITADPSKNRLAATASSARNRIDFFAAVPLTFDVHNRFDPPALNWRKKTSGGSVIQYPDQWHAAVSPLEKTKKMRYLAIIQVLDKGNERAFDSSDRLDHQTVRVGPWSIAAELDPARSATMEIKSTDQGTGLAVNKGSVSLGTERHAATRPNSAILIEKLPDREIVRESSDSYPWR
jgi:hypothetical protein